MGLSVVVVEVLVVEVALVGAAPDERPPREPRRRRRRLPPSPVASSPGLAGSTGRNAPAGMVSPILGLGGAPGGGALGTTALAAASTDAGPPPRWRSGSSGVRSSGAGPVAGEVEEMAGAGRGPFPRPLEARSAGGNGWRWAWAISSTCGWVAAPEPAPPLFAPSAVRGLLRLRPPREPRRRRLPGVPVVAAPPASAPGPAPLPSPESVAGGEADPCDLVGVAASGAALGVCDASGAGSGASVPPGTTVSAMGGFPSHDARTSACGGGVAAGGRAMTSRRAPPTCVHLLMRVTPPARPGGAIAARNPAG